MDMHSQKAAAQFHLHVLFLSGLSAPIVIALSVRGAEMSQLSEQAQVTKRTIDIALLMRHVDSLMSGLSAHANEKCDILSMDVFT
jgi:hypothetical protein